MMPDQQQRILGYFIEEAKDHLNTIEQGLLSLQATIEDSETVNEVFRAAHSIKGGAAMLGIESVQRTAHRLEDYFKILKEAPVQTDRTLESMFLQVFDGLQSLVEELQGPFGLTDEKAKEVMGDIEPVFSQLEVHLNTLAETAPALSTPTSPAIASPAAPKSQTPHTEASALKLVFRSDVPGHLREMLGLFKQADTPASRATLAQICANLQQIGEQFELSAWCELAQAAQQAVSNTDQTYRTLAPVVIKDLKQAQEQVLNGQGDRVTPSAAMQELLPPPSLAPEPTEADLDALLDDALGAPDEADTDLADLFGTDAEIAATPPPEAAEDLSWLDAADADTPAITGTEDGGFGDDFAAAFAEADLGATNSPAEEPALDAAPQGPEVGAAELNSLADLFEGEMAELDTPWQEGEASDMTDRSDGDSLDIDISSDFSDLLLSEEDDGIDGGAMDSQEELASLFGEGALDSSDDSASLFGEDALDSPDDSASLFGEDALDSPDDTEALFGEAALDGIDEIESIGNDLPSVPDTTDDFDDLLAVGALPTAAPPPDSSDLDDLLTASAQAPPPEASDDMDDFFSDLGGESTPTPEETAIANDLGDLFGEDPGASEATAGDDLGGLFEEDSAATGATASGETDWDLDLALDGENDSDAAGAAPDLAFPDDGDDTLLGEEAAPQSGDAEDALEAAFADSAAFADDSDDSLDLGLDLDWEGSSDTGEESDIPSPTATTEDDLDLDLGFDAETADAADDADDLELDLGFDSASEEEFALDSPNDSEADGDLDLDFGFDLDATPGAEAAIAADSDLGEDDLSTAEFDLNFEEAVADAEAAEFELDFEGLSPDADSDQDLVGDLDLAFDLGDGDASADLSELDMAAVSLDESRESDGDVNLASSPDPAAEMTMDLWGDDTSPSPTPSPGIAAVAAAGVAAIDDPWAEGEDATVDPDEALAALDNLWDDSASDAVPTDDAGELAADADALFADFDEIEEEGIEVPAAHGISDDFDDLFGNDDGAVEDSIPGLEENLDSPMATEAASDPGAADLDDLFGNDAEMAASLDDGTDPFGMDAFGTSADDETDDLEALLSTETGEAEAWGETDDSDLLAVDLLDAGAADLPDISTTPDAIAAEADLDELDALLDDEPTDAIPAADDFDDLDAMLGEASSAADDGFDDLEAMLDDDEPLAADADTDGSFTALDALLEDEADPETDQESDDEFGDLEKLLEAADQSLGGGSPSIRGGGGGGRTSRRVGAMVDQTMRVSVKHLDTLSNLVGELVVNRNSLEQDQERLRQFLDNLLFQVQQLNDVGQRMRDLYERSLLESSLISSRQAFHAGVSSGGNGGFSQGNGDGEHATGATFDALEMDRFTGFHTLSQEMIELIVRVRESASDIGYTVESSDQITRQFRQVTTQLQEGLNKARMVPFAQTADRLPRAVRDISLKCGKEARLVVEGRDTLIDKMILERLYDPMTHLVNNAITHGIEPPEERVAAGKPREGTITVRAFYQGNQTVIYIADDGAGINTDVVKQKAIKKGLITQAEARSMSELETHDLLFRPGFSTRDQADDFAGRGVGMDVVRTALSEIRGAITIDSTMGKGTGFTIRLPLTLSISKALSCLNNQARIAFPMDGVEDMFDVPKERVQTDAQGRNNILWRDTQLTFQPLSDLLQFSRTLGRGRVYGGSQDDDMVSIVVLRNANTYIGLQVDRVLGEQEIVIKQLEGPVPKPAGIAGATVLGDGRVMPIADVLELIDLAQGRVRRESTASLWAQDAEPPAEEAEAVKAEPTVLIVDDSITVRELLSMSFNKVGYRVEQARDGQEAWEKLRSGLPCDLVFCDIEMPRMDGLELLSRMQKDGVLKHVPIAMLTSRGADRHRQMALDLGASGYFTKPYLEEALLDAAQRMLKGEVLLHPTKDKEE